MTGQQDHHVAVLMLGEHLDRPGGVVTVQKAIIGNTSSDVDIVHLPTLKDGSSLTKIAVFLKTLFQLIAKLASRRVDLVHIHVSTGGSVYRQTITALIAQTFKHHVVMHCHSGKFPSFFERQPAWAKAVVAFVFRRCHRLLVVSHHWHSFYAEKLGIAPSCIVVMPNPVALPADMPARKPSSAIQMIFLGQVNQAKGVFDLIEATAKVSETFGERFHVTIAGHGDLAPAKAMVATMGVQANVTFLGWIGSDERDRLLREADVFLLPSYFEGLPMSLLEAMSFGLPSIATSVGGIPDVFDHEVEGFLMEPGDVEALGNAMRRLIEDASLREAMGRAARKRIEPLDIKPYIANLESIYRHVTDRLSAVG